MTTTTNEKRPIVKADSRGRVSLTKHASVTPGQMFFIDVRSDGVIELTPAQAVPVWAVD